ncbi:hypothetical protein [Burkholderia ubonensis]|uniref:hypothetical protein n=1 Tax=Burkholderia ubonensis TaxID=101571 RepID=UPI000B0462D3|nr:hypothetical protein [Burkholderia ubonensis]
MFHEGFYESGCILTPEHARQLLLLRNAYDYPRAYMRKTRTPTRYPLAPGLWAEPVYPSAGEVTDRVLDRYHSMLLNSKDPVNNLLGTTSVIFWGFFTMGGRAPLRAENHLTGLKTKPGTNPQAAGLALAAVRAQLDPGKALGHLAPLAVLGQMPFASKVVAHSRPWLAGVMDNQLHNGLCSAPWAKATPFIRVIGPVNVVRYQVRYTHWCKFLVALADQLNAGIAGGRPWGWAENGRCHRWRAIDIERALFQYYRRKKSNPASLAKLLGRTLELLSAPEHGK